MAKHILKNNILKAVVGLSMVFLLVLLAGISGLNSMDIVNSSQKPCELEESSNMVFCYPTSPFNITLSVNQTPVFNESFDVISTIKSDINISNVSHEFELPSEIEFISGNLSWNGSLQKDEIKNMTVSVRITGTGYFIICSTGKDANSIYIERASGLYFSVNGSNVTTSDSPIYQLRASVETEATIGAGSGTPGQNNNITISGNATYKNKDKTGNVDIPYAKIELYRYETHTGENWTNTQYYLKRTNFTEEDGCYRFDPIEPGDIKVRLCVESHKPDYKAVKVLNADDDLYDFYNISNVTDNSTVDFNIDEDERGAWEMYNNILKEYSWLHEKTGWTLSSNISHVQVIWPSGSWPRHSLYKIYIPNDPNDQEYWPWKNSAAWHEYAHAVMYKIMGFCPPAMPDHYFFSEFTPEHAITEGWAEFMEEVMADVYLQGDGGQLEHPNKHNVFADHDKGDFGDWDGNCVEGAVASVFWDIYDPIDVDDAPHYIDLDGDYFSFSGYGDKISDKFNDIWDILDIDHPNSIDEFWEFWDAEGDEKVDIWAIFYNQRINKDSTPPTLPYSYVSNIEVNNYTLNNDITVNWSGANDNLSGVYGYSISWTENEHSLPPKQDSDNVTQINQTSTNLDNGTWYLNIRPVDRAKNWNDEHYWVGPFLIGNSDPQLTDGNVQPKVGIESSTYTFSVNYSDKESHNSQDRYLYIKKYNNDEYDRYEMDGEGCDATYSLTRDGVDIGLGKHDFYFNFTDIEGGDATFPEEGGPLNFTVAPNMPIIWGPEKVHPTVVPWYKYKIKLSELDELSDFYVKIDLEGNGIISWVIIDNTIYINQGVDNNRSTTGWFKCEPNTFFARCRWPLLTYEEGDYKMKVTSKYMPEGQENISSSVGEYEINCSWSNWGCNPLDIFWTIQTNGPYAASEGEDISFTSNIDGGTSPYSVTWDFGDGNIANGQNVMHSFDEPGFYPIICSVEDETGMRNENFTNATISGVKLTAGSSVVLKDESINFTATLYGMEPSTNHWYVFSTGHQVQDSDADGVASISTSFSDYGNQVINVTLRNGSANGTIIDSDSVAIKVIPFMVDAGGPYAALSGDETSFEGVVYYNYQWISAVWDFGDGQHGTGLSVKHTYEAEQNTTYNVTLTVTIPGAGNNSDNTTATIWNISGYDYPVAVLDGPYCGNKGESITIDGSNSTGDGLEYYWKIGDGIWENDNAVIIRSFSDVGNDYPEFVKVELRVVDNYSFSDTTFTYVTISELTADFHWIPPIPNDVQSVFFYDDSAPDGCNDVDTWSWDFGDYSYSSQQNPQHEYGDDGYYYVKLTVWAGSEQSTVTKRIYINNVAPEAGFKTSPLVAPVNEPVSFNCTSYDVDGEVVLWERVFGDDSYSYYQNETHNYSSSGFYSITTYIMDDDLDQDSITKNDHLLIADAIVDKDFNDSSPGWNVTRFNDLQKGIDAVPSGGILAVLDDTYNATDLKVNKSMDIYAIQKGYNENDTEIQYGDVEIHGEGQFPIFNVTAPNVKIKGFTLTGGVGMEIESDNVTIQDCTFTENAYGINCSDSSHVTICNTVLSGNEAGSIKLTNSDNITIQGTEISYGKYGVTINNSVDNTIIDCNLTEIGECIQLVEGSDDNTIQNCRIDYVQGTAILIDNSTGNVISDCKINLVHKGVEIVDVCPDDYELEIAASSEMLNTIQDTDFNNVYYGVYIYNSSYTRIGKKFWSLGEMEGLYPIYYYPGEDIYEGPAIPFPSDLQVATNLFAHNDYPIYIDHSHHNVVDGIAIALQVSSYTQNISSSRTGISINHSNNNLVASCLIQNANCSAINITQSENNTVCLCMLKKNQQGITAEGCNNNLIIACSFFNNTDYGLEMKDDTLENFVMYNDFVFNNGSTSSGPVEYNQAYDAGEMNMWDDEGQSLWRDMVSGNHELEANESRIIGNFWSDYSGIYSEEGSGPIPSEPGSTDWFPTGEEPYYISGPIGSKDGGPILHSVWPESWYVSDDPEQEDPTPEPLPPIPIP